MLAHPRASYPPAVARLPRRPRAGFTLLETMVALAIFVIGGMGVIETLGLVNNAATADRALTAARLLVGAKIAKAQTDTWTPSNNVVPPSCVAPTGGIATADPRDAFDFSGTNVTVVGSTDTGAVITGTMTQTVAPFETASQSLLITYTLTFTYRGKTYSVSQSTIRAPDQL